MAIRSTIWLAVSGSGVTPVSMTHTVPGVGGGGACTRNSARAAIACGVGYASPGTAASAVVGTAGAATATKAAAAPSPRLMCARMDIVQNIGPLAEDLDLSGLAVPRPEGPS